MSEPTQELPEVQPAPTAEALDAGLVDSEPEAGEAASEASEYLQSSQLRRRVFPRAALVGALAGSIAVAFRALLGWSDNARDALIDWAHGLGPAGIVFPVAFGVGGAALAVYLVRRFAPEASGSGIPHLEAVFHRYRDMDARRVLPVKFAGGLAALGSGMALGREGPTVQMGGAVGELVARALKVTTPERFTLIAAGAGAGLAAAFNAPLAGLVFVLEEVQRDFRPVVFGAALLASAIANLIAQAALGQHPVFSLPSYPILPLSDLPTFVLLGSVAGLLGIAFNRGMVFMLDAFGRIPAPLAVPAAGAVGAAIGVVAWFAPVAVGGGHALSELVLGGRIALSLLPAWFALRFALTLTSYATGAPGGIFAPLLALGAILGMVVGQVVHMALPSAITMPGAVAVVGMAAYFTAIVRAPLTGVVLIVEMTGDYNQMLPLLVACFSAYAVAERLGDMPIYERLLERDLARGGDVPHLREPMVIEVEVEPGALFAGREVRALGLPPGCIIVQVRDGGRDTVPTADMRLRPHMRLSAVIAPSASGAAKRLREGCAAPD